ncbi:MAG: hypothetical protein AMXMBFR47_15340 [Planctomycetota bacterium]
MSDITMGISNRKLEEQARRREAEKAAARRQLNTVDSSPYVRARILWPAVGFPAVIHPQSGGAGDTSDPTRCLWLLVVSNKENLHKGDVARHLRWAAWDKRHTRWSEAAEQGGEFAFQEEELNVTRPVDERSKSRLTKVIKFAHVKGDERGIVVGLSKFVLDFYASYGLKYLHQIQVYEYAAARLAPHAAANPVNLYWVNRNRNDTPRERSAEMDLLIEEFARFSRFGHDGVPPEKELDELIARRYLEEYEYDYAPNDLRHNIPENRTEVLHPVFVRPPKPAIRIGHLTDLHFELRCDAYETRLRNSVDPAITRQVPNFNNWNKTSRMLYRRARGNCDLLLLTGDLIEYGRGFSEHRIGEDGLPDMSTNECYWRDRPWFLFFSELAGGTNYQKPAYTILGNHDWRFHPYKPLAEGAPGPRNFNLEDKEAIKVAHGPGHGGQYSLYDGGANYALAVARLLWHKWIIREGELEIGGTPLVTTTASVAWYLLLINPFLDYSVPLPGGYDLLMLDWGENELVDFHEYRSGVDRGGTVVKPNSSGEPAPKDTLTDDQREVIEHFLASNNRARILGIHAPVVGPHGRWTDEYLAQGKVVTPLGSDARLSQDGKPIVSLDGKAPHAKIFQFEETRDGRKIPRAYLEHPALAAPHKDYAPWNWVADAGTPLKHREWLIEELRKAAVPLVVSGHVHRRSLVVVDKQPNGALFVRGLRDDQIAGAPYPLYVNTTSCGPRGRIHAKQTETIYLPSAYVEIELASSGKVLKLSHQDAANDYEKRKGTSQVGARAAS